MNKAQGYEAKLKDTDRYIGAGISSQAAFTDGTHGAKADAHGSKPDKADERYPRMDECLRPVAPVSKAKTSGTE